MNTKNQKRLPSQGFTLVELMVAMAISLVVMGAIFLTFKSQQDSYVIQDQITATQQNLRAAMYMLTRDIQMAGYYTNFDSGSYTMDWDDLGVNEVIRPLIYARNNVADGGGDNIKDNTDLIVIIKASSNNQQLVAGETASGNTVDASLRAVDNLEAGKCALLVKENLSRAEFFQVQEDSGDMSLTISLVENYGVNDWIYRADVIIYYVDNEDDPGDPNDNDDPAHPKLRRKNLGSNQGAQVVAENIDNLQFQYLLSTTGGWTNNLAIGQEINVRAVKISLLARTANTNRGYTDTNTYNIGDNPNPNPNDAYRRKLLSSIVKTRNIGL